MASVGSTAIRVRINLGGEGEVLGVINQQGRWALASDWKSSRDGKTLTELRSQGHIFIIAHNIHLPFGNNTVHEVITNSVPINISTYLGPGVQESEITRILISGGTWVHDGLVRYRKP